MCTILTTLQKRVQNMWKGGSVRERGLECLLETAGPHTELKQEIPASGGRGDFGAAKES